MKITKFDKAACREISEEMRKALATVAEKYGIDVIAGGGSYDPAGGTFKPKVEFKLKEIDGKSRERVEFERYADIFGLKPTDYGRELRVSGQAFALVGLAPNRSKFPVIAATADGTKFKFSEYILDQIRGPKTVTMKAFVPR